MDLRPGVGQEKGPKGLPSISGPTQTKACGTLRFWGYLHFGGLSAFGEIVYLGITL